VFRCIYIYIDGFFVIYTIDTTQQLLNLMVCKCRRMTFPIIQKIARKNNQEICYIQNDTYEDIPVESIKISSPLCLFIHLADIYIYMIQIKSQFTRVIKNCMDLKLFPSCCQMDCTMLMIYMRCVKMTGGWSTSQILSIFNGSPK